MNLAKLLVYFETSPALKLLRSPNAPYLIDFLHRQFKRSAQLSVPQSELLAQLAAYQEELAEEHPEALRDRPEVYLRTWSAGETRWLRRVLEASRSEPVYELTPHTEDALSFLDRVLDQDLGFVGTGSRLNLVISTLTDLVVGASQDPTTRLDHLREQRERLDRQIAQIERDGLVDAYHPARIREQFSAAVGLLKDLQGDFRAVEEKFKEITRQVQQRQSTGRDTRGGILEFALDSEDLLKEQDQGVSFAEFVRFILNPAEQDRLQAVIAQLVRLPELMDQAEGLESVKRMVPLLLAEADKVMRTNHRLSATLRHLLDAQAHRERARIAQLLREIRGLARELADAPPEEIGLSVDVDAEIASPMSRSFWKAPPELATVDLTEHVVDPDKRRAAFAALAQLQRLDWHRLRDQIRSATHRSGMAPLRTLLAEHPPESGVVEVLGYVQIANDEGHLIDPTRSEEIVLPPNGDSPALTLTMPHVTFVDKPSRPAAEPV
jgi:hypothetical protein